MSRQKRDIIQGLDLLVIDEISMVRCDLLDAVDFVLRRQRGGQVMLLEHLWPKLKMIVSCDYRITTTGLYYDYILPAAQHYEKLGQAIPSVHHLNWVLTDHATKPPGKALPDLHISMRLLEAIESRASASMCGVRASPVP